MTYMLKSLADGKIVLALEVCRPSSLFFVIRFYNIRGLFLNHQFSHEKQNGTLSLLKFPFQCD